MRSTAYPDCVRFPNQDECQRICQEAQAWPYPQNMTDSFRLGAARDRETCLSFLEAEERMSLVMLPANTNPSVHLVLKGICDYTIFKDSLGERPLP